MKIKILIICILCAICIASCQPAAPEATSSECEETVTAPNEKSDSLELLINQIDSLQSKGKLRHIDNYQIANIKGIKISVEKLATEEASICYLNFKKDVGGQYYYDWENSRLIEEEINYFIEAIDTFVALAGKTSDHDERLIYVTKDKIRLFADCTPNKSWNYEFSINYTNSRASVTMNCSDLITLKEKILEAQQKLNEVK